MSDDLMRYENDWTDEDEIQLQRAMNRKMSSIEQKMRELENNRKKDTQLILGKHQQLEDKLKEYDGLKEAAQFGNAVGNTHDGMLIRTYVKILYDKHGVTIGMKDFYAWLSNKGYIFRERGKWVARRQYVEQGLFILKETVVSNDFGDFTNYTINITGKGQRYFYEKLIKDPTIVDLNWTPPF